MALDSRTMRRVRPILSRLRAPTLGEWGLEFIAPIAGAAIQAGATVGAAAITADAAKSVAKTSQRTALEIALDQDRVRLAEIQAGTVQNAQDTTVASQAVSSGVWALLALGAAALFLGGR